MVVRRVHRMTIEVECDEPTDPYRWPWERIVRDWLRGSALPTEDVEVRVVSDQSDPVL